MCLPRRPVLRCSRAQPLTDSSPSTPPDHLVAGNASFRISHSSYLRETNGMCVVVTAIPARMREQARSRAEAY